MDPSLCHPVINYSKKSTEGAVIYSYVSYENKKHVVYIHTSLFKTCSVLKKKVNPGILVLHDYDLWTFVLKANLKLLKVC